MGQPWRSKPWNVNCKWSLPKRRRRSELSQLDVPLWRYNISAGTIYIPKRTKGNNFWRSTIVCKCGLMYPFLKRCVFFFASPGRRRSTDIRFDPRGSSWHIQPIKPTFLGSKIWIGTESQGLKLRTFGPPLGFPPVEVQLPGSWVT